MKKLHNISMIFIALSYYGCCITKPDCDPAGGNFNYGPEVSYRTASYYGEDAKNDDFKYTGNINLGVFAHWVFCEDYPDMGINSGLFFNQFGARYDYEGDAAGSSSRDRLSYLTIPFTFTYQVIEGLRAEAGPDLSFLVAAKEIYKYDGGKEIYDIKENIANVQVGFNLGISYTHDETGLGGFVRYNGAFTKIPSGDNEYKAYNAGFSLGVRYRINHLFYRGDN
jgi:hypothetical protein